MEIRKIGQKDLVFRYAQLQVFLDGLTPSFASQNEKRCPTADIRRLVGSASQLPLAKKQGSAITLPCFLTHPYKIDPYKAIVQKQSVIFDERIDLSLGDDGSCT